VCQLFRYCRPDEPCQGCPNGWKGPNCTIECQGGSVNPCNGRGACLEDPPGECACQKGYSGKACETLTKDGLGADAAAEAGRRGGSMRAGMLLGVGLSASVLAVACLALYVKRRDVMEHVYWWLAATRFERLRQGGAGGAASPSAAPARDRRRTQSRLSIGPRGYAPVLEDDEGIMMAERGGPTLAEDDDDEVAVI
jgi:hypothetical protein